MSDRQERETIAAINNPAPLNVRFESQVINGVEYVTAEQHRQGMAQAAEQGRRLRCPPCRRSKLEGRNLMSTFAFVNYARFMQDSSTPTVYAYQNFSVNQVRIYGGVTYSFFHLPFLLGRK